MRSLEKILLVALYKRRATSYCRSNDETTNLGATMTTTIRELINTLEEQAETLGDDAQVLIATQPGWPLALQVAGATSLAWEGRESEGGHDRDDATLWIVAGSHPDDDPYAPGWVFDAVASAW